MSSPWDSSHRLRHTVICRDWQAGTCTTIGCKFAHGEDQLKPKPNFKMLRAQHKAAKRASKLQKEEGSEEGSQMQTTAIHVGLDEPTHDVLVYSGMSVARTPPGLVISPAHHLLELPPGLRRAQGDGEPTVDPRPTPGTFTDPDLAVMQPNRSYHRAVPEPRHCFKTSRVPVQQPYIEWIRCTVATTSYFVPPRVARQELACPRSMGRTCSGSTTDEAQGLTPEKSGWGEPLSVLDDDMQKELRMFRLLHLLSKLYSS
mmetsp:Transcript_28315/g.73226  ORF Transcript_28315/g.73226 Transcript_28315/m.73226 type:complete len:258 (-) Transcript_28315:130-903(-)